MTIERISPYIVVLDTTVIIEDLSLDFTFYLNDIPNGYSVTYNLNFNNEYGIVSFDILRTE